MRFRELLYVAGKMSDMYQTQTTPVALPVVHFPVAVVILRLPYLATVCRLEFRNGISSLDLFCVIRMRRLIELFVIQNLRDMNGVIIDYIDEGPCLTAYFACSMYIPWRGVRI